MRLGIPRWEFFGWLDKRLGNGALGVFWADKRLGNGALGVFWADKRLGNGGFWECFGLGNGLGRGSEVFCVSFLVFGGLRDVGIPSYPRDGSFCPQEWLGVGLGIEFEAWAQDWLFRPKYRWARKLARVAHGIPGLPEPHPSTQISTLTIVNP
jgi:hypothetical protein